MISKKLLKGYNGWANYFTWAVNLWITSVNEYTLRRFENIAKNNSFNSFKNQVNQFIDQGYVKDLKKFDKKRIKKIINYKELYKGLKGDDH